jgi:hypothetical protein
MTERFAIRVVPVQPRHDGLHKQWPWLHEHPNDWLWVLGVRIRPGNQIVPPFSWQRREHLTLSHWNGACNLTLLTGEEKPTHAYEDSGSLHRSALYWNPPDLKKKIRPDTFLTEYVLCGVIGLILLSRRGNPTVIIYTQSPNFIHDCSYCIHSIFTWIGHLILKCSLYNRLIGRVSGYKKWQFRFRRNFHNFKCGLSLERRSPSLMRTFG